MNKYLRLLMLFSILLIVSCIMISTKRLMWTDELFSYYSTRDPNIKHMVAGIGSGINAVPPLYFLLTSFIFKLGLESVHVFRLFSCICIILSIVVLWKALRKHLPESVATAAILITAGGCTIIFVTNAEFRYYGLFFLLESLTVYYSLLLLNSPSSIKYLFSLCLCTALACLTHLFGIFYATALIISFITQSFIRKQNYYKIILAIAAGALWLLVWFRQLLLQADTGRPHSWIPVPELIDLKIMILHFIPYYEAARFHNLIFFFILMGLFVFIIRFRKKIPEFIQPVSHDVSGTRLFLLIAGICMIIVPVVIAYIISKNFISIFHERYFTPSLIGIVLLLSYLLSLVRITEIRWSYYFSCLLLLIGSLRLMQFTNKYADPQVVIFKKIHEKLMQDPYPVVFESAINFLPFRFYHPSINAIFPLDWKIAMHPANELNAGTDFKLMMKMKSFYQVETIIDAKQLIERDSIFYVVDESKRLWLEQFMETGKFKLLSAPLTITDEIKLVKVQVLNKLPVAGTQKY